MIRRSTAASRQVYRKAAHGSPPMSVPHLDTRVIGGSTRSCLGHTRCSPPVPQTRVAGDWFFSLRPKISTAAGRGSATTLTSPYLIVSAADVEHRFAALLDLYPRAREDDWHLEMAASACRPSTRRAAGTLEAHRARRRGRPFADCLARSVARASTAVHIALGVLEKCFKHELTPDHWLPKLKEMIPSYRRSPLIDNADLVRRVRADTAAVLRLENV